MPVSKILCCFGGEENERQQTAKKKIWEHVRLRDNEHCPE
jgi:hypothetical protein